MGVDASSVVISIVGNSNESNLILNSSSSNVNDDSLDQTFKHATNSHLEVLDLSVNGISLAINALKAKDLQIDASITSLGAKDLLLTSNIVDVSSAVVALKAKDLQIDASINNVKNNILDLQNNEALEMSYSAASASIAQYIAKTVTIPLATLCTTISGDRVFNLPPVWNIGEFEQINRFPSLHYSHVYPHIGDNVSESTDPYIIVAFPKNYNPLKTYPTLLYIEDISGMYVGSTKYLQDSSGFMDAFKGTDLSDGFFIVGIQGNLTISPATVYPFVSWDGRNIVLTGVSLNTPQPDDDVIYYNLINMIRIELIPYLKQNPKYAGMRLDRDSLILSGKSNGGYFVIKTMFLFPEIASRCIANNPFICVSKVLPTIGLVATYPYVTGYKIDIVNGKQQLRYEVDEVAHRKHLSFVRDNAKRIADMGLKIQIATFNNFGSAKDLYDNCGNTPGSLESTGFTNIGVESACGGFNYFVLPALEAAGFSSAPALDHEFGIPGDRLLSSRLKVFTTESSKNFSDHNNVAGWDNLHEILCKLYAVPDSSFSHVKYLDTKTLSNKTDFKAHYLTTLVDASFNLSVTFNQSNTRMWKTRYTLVNGYADGSNAVFDSMRRFNGGPSLYTTTNNARNNSGSGSNVFKLLPSDPVGKTLKVEFLNKDNVAVGTTSTVVTRTYAFTSSYTDSSNVWLALDASLNYTPNLALINALE